LERLSLRDLYWYCYLDQDSMDSSFFLLDREADTFKRLKSRNVLRSILGVHQERVAELEQRLEELRRKRQRYSESACVLEQSLQEAQFSTLEEIESREKELVQKLEMLQRRIVSIRADKTSNVSHVADRLRDQARQIASELQAVENALEELAAVNADDRRHRNEILALSTKVRRLESARAVLNDVEFVTCPRCTRQLPDRQDQDCHVCGQSDELEADEIADGERTQADIVSRVKELEEMMDAQLVQMRRIRRRREELSRRKQDIDQELTEVMQQYDSAYLAEAIAVEKELAELTQELNYLKRIKVLPSRVHEMKKLSDSLATDESTTRRELKEAREAAEQDLTNLQKLKKLFLDCLLRARVPGFEPDDIVQMTPPWFLPEVHGNSGEMATTSFSTLGSGGKKNLFKCCFALAVHRLSSQLGTLLPSVLVIDSPMKNISERENRVQFEGFHKLLYQLSTEELAGTQIILIDKEFCPPDGDLAISITSRHMRVDSDDEPPLIQYYRGK
jgi:rRNA maturation endonuclease Nob1